MSENHAQVSMGFIGGTFATKPPEDKNTYSQQQKKQNNFNNLYKLFKISDEKEFNSFLRSYLAYKTGKKKEEITDEQIKQFKQEHSNELAELEDAAKMVNDLGLNAKKAFFECCPDDPMKKLERLQEVINLYSTSSISSSFLDEAIITIFFN